MKHLKSLQEFLKSKDLKKIQDRFNSIVNYDYGKTKTDSDDDYILFIVLDSDDTLCNNFNHLPKLILEYETYKKFPPTKCVFRLDNGNNAIGQQRHIHVYSDKNHNNQLYAINIDGTPHDGSKIRLNKRHQEALKKVGFPVPKDGILEWYDLGKCKLLLD